MLPIDDFQKGRLLALAGQPLPPNAGEDVIRGHRNGTHERQTIAAARPNISEPLRPLDRYAD